MEKQVEKGHYGFGSYVSKQRWNSYWHQLDEVLRLSPSSVLEVGVGPGIFQNIARLLQLNVVTVDIDPELKPDHVASVEALPFADSSHDVVAAFQVLEHLPFASLATAARELRRVAKRHVVVSLPDSRILWRYLFHIPKLGDFNLFIRRPTLGRPDHVFDGQHHWEINKKNYPLKAVLNVFSEQGLHLLKTFLVPEYTYHRFMVFRCAQGAGRPDSPVAPA